VSRERVPGDGSAILAKAGWRNGQAGDACAWTSHRPTERWALVRAQVQRKREGEKWKQKRKMAQKSLSEPFVLKKLVRLAGIEPTTPWFVAKYSIQLSYSRPMRVL
jgi:hypothetical protein